MEIFDTTEALTAEYVAWLDVQGLPQYCADETWHDILGAQGDKTSDERDPAVNAQLDYLREFIERWNVAEEREDAAARVEYSNGQTGYVVFRAVADPNFFIMFSNGEYLVCYQQGSQLNGDDADWCILNDENGFKTMDDAKVCLEREMASSPDETF